MRILDKYILKKYLITFVFVQILLVPVIIAVDISEKIDKFLRHADLTVWEIVNDYYVNFIVNIGNMILPLALFVSVLFFTSKMASNVEIIAMNSAKISFTRFLKPYFIGATIVTLFSLWLNHFIVPRSSKTYSEFTNTYIKTNPKKYNQISNVNLQLSENEYVYTRIFNLDKNIGFDFCYEKYDGIELKQKILADNIKWSEKDTMFTLNSYYKRTILGEKDLIETQFKFDTIFNFRPKDLLHEEAYAKEIETPKLLEYIEISKARGRGNLNVYYVELYKRTSLPIASYILTLIAVALGSVKRRGGIGLNLTVGVILMFVYIFLLKIVEVLGSGADSNPLFMVWLPNILFTIIAVYLYFDARK